jgi:omega-amidase
MLSQEAKKHKIYIIGGSIPELSEGNIYNACLVYNPSGDLVAKHRKVHLLDINIPGKVKFQESLTLTPGNQITSFKTKWGNIGIGICYDLRFCDYATVLAREKDCKLLCYPSAFSTQIGSLHWELLLRGRALDNQVFVAGISPARSKDGYQAWGHSTIINPWGKVLATTDHEETIVFADIDFSENEEFQRDVPLPTQRRLDVYTQPHTLQRACEIQG